jgi:hypothetical protein
MITAVAEWNEPLGETSISYKMTNQYGMTDVGFVTGEVVPCFVEGTRIATALGLVPVKDILVGDLVMTLGHGSKPVMRHGVGQVPSSEAIAVVRLPAGSFGEHGPLAVSPRHRLHFGGRQLYANEKEVLLKAVDPERAGRLTQDHLGRPSVTMTVSSPGTRSSAQMDCGAKGTTPVRPEVHAHVAAVLVA